MYLNTGCVDTWNKLCSPQNTTCTWNISVPQNTIGTLTQAVWLTEYSKHLEHKLGSPQNTIRTQNTSGIAHRMLQAGKHKLCGLQNIVVFSCVTAIMAFNIVCFRLSEQWRRQMPLLQKSEQNIKKIQQCRSEFPEISLWTMNVMNIAWRLPQYFHGQMGEVQFVILMIMGDISV